MRGRTAALGASAAICALAAPVAAQDWTVTGTVYGWLPGLAAEIGTPLGTIDAEPSGGSVLDILEGVFMGRLWAQRGRWGVAGDLIYVDLEATQETPFGLLFDDGTVETRATALSAYGTYRAYEGPRLAFDVAAGFRAFDVSIDTDLRSAGRVEDRSFGLGAEWVLPLVGVRAEAALSERWFASAYADVGGDFDDASTWQGFASVGYRFSDRWAAQLGYRHMSIGQRIDGFDIDIDLSGPQIGLSARF
jgi:opacity protein-like surface antigen